MLDCMNEVDEEEEGEEEEFESTLNLWLSHPSISLSLSLSSSHPFFLVPLVCRARRCLSISYPLRIIIAYPHAPTSPETT